MRTISSNKSWKKCTSNPQKEETERSYSSSGRGRISVVGIGPGQVEHMTLKARQVIENAEVVIGYITYLRLVQKIMNPAAEVLIGIMGHEIERARAAIDKALDDKRVVVISSGDPGIYGMAGLILEVAELEQASIPIEIVPGVTAATAAAAKLGAPLMNDFSVISLSDLLTPWSLIEKRLHAAAEANFVIVLYNPASKGRRKPLKKAHEIILKYQDPKTPVGIVKQVGRKDEEVRLTTLEKLLSVNADMTTTIIIGNSTTREVGNWMVTPRGYHL